MSNIGLKLLARAVSAVAKLIADAAQDNTANPPAYTATSSRTARTSQTVTPAEKERMVREFEEGVEAAKTIEMLNRSQVFRFRYEPKKGIILTECKKEHNVSDLCIPDVVDRIGEKAFKDCLFLESINIPDSVTVIERYAFQGCKNLKNVRFPAKLSMIYDLAFSECGLTEAMLPDGVKMLGNGAFSKDEQLKRARVPSSVSTFSNGLFSGCTALEEIDHPMNMSGKIYSLFSHCESLTSICLPDGLRSVDDWSMEYCKNLTYVYIPKTVKKLCNRAFLGCESLEEVYIPDSVEEIEVAAVFARCHKLKKVRLPVGIRFTPRFDKPFDKIFFKCDELHTVVLGSRTFTVDEPPDENSILYMHAVLAAEGSPSARDYVLDRFLDTLTVLIDMNKTEVVDQLVEKASMTVDMKEIIDKAIDAAAEKEAHEIYLTLLQFKRDKLGFETNEDRFRL